MKNKSLFIICAFIYNVAAAQNRPTPAYLRLVFKADSFYNAKDYKQSAFTYSAAFKSNKWKARSDDRYNAACSWALALYPDSAFFNLKKIAYNGTYSDYDHIVKDADLTSLKNDSRRPALLKIISANRHKAEAHYNRPLVAELDQIFKDDQSGRLKLAGVSKQYGYNSKQMDELWDDIGQKDSVNLIKVEGILNKYGWLGRDVIGNKGTTTLFIVIQHADQQIQEKYLPLMRDAVKKGNANASDFALLEDRVALEEGKKQLYGSQYGTDPATGKSYFRPIEDEANVNKRRASVGLGTLEEYARQFNIDLNSPKH